MMKITDISRYKGDTFVIETEPQEKFYMHQSIISQFGFYKGMEIAREEIDSAVNENTYRRAKERALYLLDSREYGFVELYKKLSANYSEEICLRVCKKLAELRLIDDRRYAARLAEYYSCTKRFGKYRAKQEIIRRGITSSVAEEALAEYDENSTERLAEVVSAKYERYLTDKKGFQKVKNALVRLGYSFSQINEVLDEYDCEDG